MSVICELAETCEAGNYCPKARPHEASDGVMVVDDRFIFVCELLDEFIELKKK